MDSREFYQQAILVLTFLGGITFAGLVLIISSSSTFNPAPPTQIPPFPSPIAYFDFLIGGFTAVSALCIMGSVVMLYLSLEDPELSLRMEKIGRVIFLFCIVGFIYLLPFLLDRFSFPLSVVFSAFDLILFTWFAHYGIAGRGLWKYPPTLEHSLQRKKESDDNRTPPNDSEKKD